MGGIENIDQGRFTQGVTPSETQVTSPTSFTMKNIANAIACAVEELHGTPLIDPNVKHAKSALHYGRMHAYTTVRQAKEAARIESEEYWEIPKLGTGRQRDVAFDESHILGIFDALTGMTQGITVKARHMAQAHLTPEVFRRAEEILFNLEPADQQTTCDLNAPLISFENR